MDTVQGGQTIYGFCLFIEGFMNAASAGLLGLRFAQPKQNALKGVSGITYESLLAADGCTPDSDDLGRTSLDPYGFAGRRKGPAALGAIGKCFCNYGLMPAHDECIF